MRIISGSLKGKSINFIKNSKTRPLKDSVKENIFNVLIHSKFIKTKIENSNILDLYSGIGSFGIEAFSRNAKKITFVEQDKEAFDILKKNLIKLSLVEKSTIFHDKIENVLLLNNNIGKFNIFFLDPPFADFNFLENLKLIKKKKFFDLNHIVILHRENTTDDNFKDLLKIVEVKRYGRSKILFGIFS
tara:strand:- start:190 stop:753 length:564 start_codon:yes stop_codon:yes gene_type:complete